MARYDWARVASLSMKFFKNSLKLLYDLLINNSINSTFIFSSYFIEYKYIKFHFQIKIQPGLCDSVVEH